VLGNNLGYISLVLFPNTFEQPALANETTFGVAYACWHRGDLNLQKKTMGRQITCRLSGRDPELVYQYKFGVQASEMYRISSLLGIGAWSPIDDHYDQLELNRSDILLLQNYLDSDQFFIPWLRLLRRPKNELFVAMISSIVAFMEQHKEVSTFHLIGEL
jgi:hypothetical protein